MINQNKVPLVGDSCMAITYSFGLVCTVNLTVSNHSAYFSNTCYCVGSL